MRKYRSCITLLSFVAIFMLVEAASAQQFRTFRIGSVWETYYAGGKAWTQSWQVPFHSFMIWPANRGFQDPWPIGVGVQFQPVMMSMEQFWIGVKNWTDPSGQTQTEFISDVTICNETATCKPLFSIKKYFRQIPPEVRVDGLLISDPFPPAPGDEVDPNIVSDQMIVSRVVTDLGVDVERRNYAYSTSYFDNIMLMETIFTNTGNVDTDDEIELPDQVLNDVYFSYAIRPTVSREGHNRNGTGEWRIHEFAEYYGADPGDSLRLFYAWDGDVRVNASEDVGDPHPENGRWLSHGFIGSQTLHADKNMDDETNDPLQPTGTQWAGFGARPNPGAGGFRAMYEFISRGHDAPSWEGSGDTPTWEGGLNTGDPDWHGQNQLFIHSSFGPFQMQFGDDYRLVHAKVVDGINNDMTWELGTAYKAAADAGNPDNFIWTNPTTGETFTGLAAKNHAIATGRDSLFKTASHAKWLAANGFNAPDPPMSPSLDVQSTGGGVLIRWGDEPRNQPDWDTGVNDFEGYRLYRAIARYDLKHQEAGLPGWELIYEGTANEYFDEGVPSGVGAFYYCTAYDDGTQNFFRPGEKLESGRFWNMTNVPAFRLKDAETSLSMVDVVPNPYNIRDPNNFPDDNNRILFVGLTPRCTITIYTVTGDKVRTIEHTSGSGDEAWDQITDFNQFVVSGVYVYHIVARDENGSATGEETMGKLIIVR